ncbi:hypothetical protein [Streptomyces sp. NPDC001927]
MTDTPRPWYTPRRLLLAAGLLVLAQAAGWWADQDGGLLLVARLFHHPMLFGVLVLGLLTSAVMLAVRSLVVRILVGAAAGLALLLTVPVMFLMTSTTSETMDRAAPGRTDRHLVVEEGSAMIDPLWWVYVDEGWGPTARRWKVGFFNGDVSSYGLTEASWAGPDRIRIVTGDVGVDARTHYIDLDPRTGKPLRTLIFG